MIKPISLLLCLLLLCGCAAQNPTSDAAPALATIPSAEVTESVSRQYLQKNGEVPGLQKFASPVPVHSLLTTETNLILFSGMENTKLAAVDTSTLELLGTHETDVTLTAETFTLQKLDSGISYFHGRDRQTVVLDQTLQEVRRIDAPDDLMGAPLLSEDGSILYYCTASAIRAMDLDTGISRILKEASYPIQGLSGLLLNDTILQVSITDYDGTFRTLFLSAENGQLLNDQEGNICPQASEDTFFLHTPGNGLTSVLFGDALGSTMILQPKNYDGSCFFPSRSNCAVNVCTTPDGTAADLYDLATGYRTARLILPGAIFPKQMQPGADGAVWFLAEEEPVLYRWDTSASTVSDDTVFAAPYYTREAPDYDGLAACSLYARELSEKYGIQILVYKDAVATQPWDYHLEYEYQPSVLQKELERLDRHLSNFPEGFLQTLTEKFTSLTISIVGRATGSPESGSLKAVNGIQFFVDFDAHIVLATDHDTEYALYHELSHLMETVVLTESVAYDRWDNLNPDDFRYDNDYNANQTRDGSPWLKAGKEYFIDTYSMSYAREDRARLFEYAMTDGHEALFSSPNLQAKLRQLSIGIREGFGLEASTGIFPWEQYLKP